MTSRIVVTKLGLYGQSKKFSSQVKVYGQPTMVDVLLHLQKVLIPRDFLEQLARIRRVELDTEVKCERLRAFDLSVDLLVGVEPVRLRKGVDKTKTKVRCFQQVQVFVDHVQKILASRSVLYLLYELSFVEQYHLAVKGLRFLAEAALHGESTRRRRRDGRVTRGTEECGDASSEEERASKSRFKAAAEVAEPSSPKHESAAL